MRTYGGLSRAGTDRLSEAVDWATVWHGTGCRADTSVLVVVIGPRTHETQAAEREKRGRRHRCIR